MQAGGADECGGERFVKFLKPGFAPESVSRLQETGSPQREHDGQHGQHDQSAGRVVPVVMILGAGTQRGQVRT